MDIPDFEKVAKNVGCLLAFISIALILTSGYIGYTIGSRHQYEKRNYTVEFISSNGDTTYLMNSKPLTSSEAKAIVDTYNGTVNMVEWCDIWYNIHSDNPTQVEWSLKCNK